MRLRVVVYNVRGFRDGLERVARVAERFEPDVLLLNESGGRLRLRRFARTVGMDVAADPWAPFRRRVKNAVLARPPWRVVEHRLHRFEGARRWYPRGALLARLVRDRSDAIVVATHLGLHPAERLRHAEELAGLLHGSAPLVVGGDLNETPERRAASLLSDRLRDAWLLGGDAAGETFPAPDPAARIDYLFVSDGIRVERVLVAGDAEAATGSDHRPVVAELELPEQG